MKKIVAIEAEGSTKSVSNNLFTNLARLQAGQYPHANKHKIKEALAFCQFTRPASVREEVDLLN